MESVVYLILYIVLPFMVISFILDISEKLLKKTKNINLSIQITDKVVIAKESIFKSKLNNFNQWIQVVVTMFFTLSIVVLFPIMDFYKINENTILNTFNVELLYKLIAFILISDLFFLNINSKENIKINNYFFISLIELLIITFFLKHEVILKTWEVLKVQNSYENLWLYKYPVLVFGMVAIKIFKFLMLHEAYTNKGSRNLRLINEAMFLNIFAFGGFMTPSFQTIEWTLVYQVVTYSARILFIYLFFKLFFNQIPRRYHVEIS
jgi:hypothetical protein